MQVYREEPCQIDFSPSLSFSLLHFPNSSHIVCWWVGVYGRGIAFKLLNRTFVEGRLCWSGTTLSEQTSLRRGQACLVQWEGLRSTPSLFYPNKDKHDDRSRGRKGQRMKGGEGVVEFVCGDREGRKTNISLSHPIPSSWCTKLYISPSVPF